MKLSILDQSPISSGKSAKDALLASRKLAKTGDFLGYTRYWIAEHHDMSGLANPNPSVMLSYIGAQTERIRLGAGAVLLPHYSPFHVAETYNLLATLFPGRIDLGIGRAPGGSAESSIALSGDFLANVKKFPEDLDELTNFIYDGFLEDDMYAKIKPSPIPDVLPQPWLLGTSEKSGVLAAEKGLPYTFGHFMSNADGPAAIQTYKKSFKQNNFMNKPESMVAVHVICAETNEEAEAIAWSNFLWKIKQDKEADDIKVPTIEEAQTYHYKKEELATIERMKKKMIIGNPQEVKKQLNKLQEQYNVDEFMIITITHSYKARLKSYELIAEEIFT